MALLPFDYAVRNLGRSPRRLLALVGGNALVVLLIAAAASFVEGMRSSMTVREDSNTVILLARGSEESIERSQIPASTPGLVSSSIAGIRTAGGVPFVSPEILSALIVYTDAESQTRHRAVVRGITPAAFLVHERVEIIEGRAPRTGMNEIMLGRLAPEKLGLPTSRLSIGQTLFFDNQPWTITGHFQALGTVMEGEIWAPLGDLQAATRRDTLSAVFITLGEAEFADVDVYTKMRVDLELSAVMESRYNAAQLQFFRPVRLMIWATALLAAMAGVLGGFNTLYGAFAARVREIGTLQALGYSRRAILFSLLQESLLAASAAVFVALGAAKIFLEGHAITHSMGVFELSVNMNVLAAGAATGVLLGALGTLPPALRCLRLPITQALKSI